LRRCQGQDGGRRWGSQPGAPLDSPAQRKPAGAGAQASAGKHGGRSGVSSHLRRFTGLADIGVPLHRATRSTVPLLHHMGEFVGNEAIACWCAGAVLTGGESDVAATGERLGLQPR
jgi:hypothetical protein